MKPIVISLTEQDYELMVKAIRSRIIYAESAEENEELRKEADALTSLYYRLESGLMDFEG